MFIVLLLLLLLLIFIIIVLCKVSAVHASTAEQDWIASSHLAQQLMTSSNLPFQSTLSVTSRPMTSAECVLVRQPVASRQLL